jgi:hypothetical protein
MTHIVNGHARWSKKARKGQAHNPVKNKGSAHRKAMARLGARIKDHAEMTGRSGWKGNPDGYHKPGSMKVYG